MSADEGLPVRVIEVALHEEVEQVSSIAPDRAQLGVAALEDFITEPGTEVGPAVKKRTRELRGWEGGGDADQSR